VKKTFKYVLALTTISLIPCWAIKAKANETEANNLGKTKLETLEKGNYQRQSADLLTGISSADTSLNQVTNVNQLRDVAPDDWAYEALRGLVDRYGCIAGFPNQTFRGNQALSRYEFAAGLNSCLQQIERLIAASEAVAKEDLDTINRLNQEFATELATIAGRVDNLEGRIGFLEDHQFSTTTIFNGEVIFGIADAFGGDPPGGCSVVPSNIANLTGVDERVDCSDPEDPDTETTFTYLARLGLETSFTGKDRLRTYLTTGNFDNGGYTAPDSLNTYMARLSYQADLDNQVILDLLEYRFPVLDDNVVISVIPFGFSLSNVLSANSPYFDTGRGAISRFAEESPIFRLGGVLDAGAGFDWKILDEVRLQVAYGTADSSDSNGGIFGADRSSLGVQLLLQPTESVVTGLTYVNSYTNDGRLGTYTGSVNAESSGLWSGGVLPDPFIGEPPAEFITSGAIALGDLPAQTNAVGGTLQWRITEKLTFGAWGGWTFTEFKDELPEFSVQVTQNPDGTPNPLQEPVESPSSGKKPFADTITYLFSLGLADPFGREGDLFAFMFGMPPKLVDAGPETQGASVPFFETSRRGEDDVEVTDNNPRLNDNTELEDWFRDNFGKEDEATSLHFEFLYRFKVSDNIFITPGFFFVTNPGHIEDNDTLYVGTIRTTFRF
jgi:Carbohydrate-selective porin, OprB family/S-layer homology domain